MIVKMKKASLVVLDTEKEASLKHLRKLGVMHIESRAGEDQKSKEVADKEQQLSRGLMLLPDQKELSRHEQFQRKNRKLPGQQSGAQEHEHLYESIRKEFAIDSIEEREYERQQNTLTPEEIEAYWFELAGQITRMTEKKRTLQDESEQLKKDEERLQPWGSFEPGDLVKLQEQQIWFKLYQLNRDELERIPSGIDFFIINEDKNYIRIAVVGINQSPSGIPGEEFRLPEHGIREIQLKLSEKQVEISALEVILVRLAGYRDTLQAGLAEYSRKLTFEHARLSMSRDDALAYLTGYVPIDKIQILEETAKTHSWALLVEDPAPDDPVPTLIRNSKPVRIIKPMFSFLGVTPGYWEFDMSFWFLIFFGIFFAMIVGDGAYGVIFLTLTIIGRFLMHKAPAEPFILLFVMSTATIIWGAITGTWFGSSYLAQLWPFSNFVIESIASFPRTDIDTGKNIMRICFILAVTHLSIAHLINFFRSLPRIKAIADLGWVGIVIGMYFLVQIMVMKQEPGVPIFAFFPEVTYVRAVLWSIGVGAGLVFIFSRQEGHFFKGFLYGLAFAPLTSLNIVSAFADIISYVRLFAVGLASVEVAKAFNNMASGVGFEGAAGIAAAFILFFGHVLNITMGALSIIVHGVRLNMLEFSGHLGLEWSGIPYDPFKEKEAD